MNRRFFLGTTAVSMAALRSEPLLADHPAFTNTPASAVAPLRDKPIEIDVVDRATVEYRRDASVEAYAQLEERFPADPAELSGASLHIGDSGRYTTLWVGFGYHCLGLVFAEELARLTARGLGDAEREFVTPLFESRPQIQPYRVNGSYLTLSGGELSLGFGGHCCGVLRGENLRVFLECVRVRCEKATR